MAISLVQFKKADGVGVASVTLTSPVSAGSLIVVTGTYDPTGTVTVSDDKSDTFTNSSIGNVVNADGIGNFVGAFLAPTTGAQAFNLNVILATFTVLGIYEFSGIASPTFDKAVQAYTNGSPTTPSSGSTGTLSDPNEVAVGYGQASTTFTAAGSGWSSDLVDTTDSGGLWEHQIVSATTALAATGTLTGASCSLFCVTFKSGGAPASPVPYNPSPQLGPLVAQRIWGWLPRPRRRPLWTPSRALWRPA